MCAVHPESTIHVRMPPTGEGRCAAEAPMGAAPAAAVSTLLVLLRGVDAAAGAQAAEPPGGMGTAKVAGAADSMAADGGCGTEAGRSATDSVDVEHATHA